MVREPWAPFSTMATSQRVLANLPVRVAANLRVAVLIAYRVDGLRACKVVQFDVEVSSR